MTEIMDKAGFPAGLSYGQILRVGYWSVFNRRRLSLFCHNLDSGMSMHFAFRYAI